MTKNLEVSALATEVSGLKEQLSAIMALLQTPQNVMSVIEAKTEPTVKKEAKAEAKVEPTVKPIEYRETVAVKGGKNIQVLKNKGSFKKYLETITDAKGNLKSGDLTVRYADYSTDFVKQGETLKNLNVQSVCFGYHRTVKTLTLYSYKTEELFAMVEWLNA